MKNLNLAIVPLGIVLLVAGCGGGGSTGGGNTGAVPTASVQITSSNSAKFASGAVSSTQQVTGSATSGNSIVGVKDIAQPTALSTHNVVNMASAEFNRVINMPLATTPITKDTLGTRAIAAPTVIVVDCVSNTDVTANVAPGTSNTYTITINMAGTSFAAQDSFSLAYTSCNLKGNSIIYAGSMTFAISKLTEGVEATYKTTFGSFSASAGGHTLSMNGDMTNGASLSGTTVKTATSQISGNSFSVSFDADGFTMNNYSETYTLDSNANYTYSINMSLVLSGIGTVDISTSPTIAGVGTVNPTTGTLKISGTNGTYVTISAYNASQAEVVVFTGSATLTSHPLWSTL